MTPIDLTDQRFGRLLVVGPVLETLGMRRKRWICVCDCGERVMPVADDLRRGATRSCGCLRREQKREQFTRQMTKHGGASRTARTREYNIWLHIKDRCLNPRSGAYPGYGGRGITVCPRWQDSFPAFLTDMGACPPGQSINRIDNDGPYEPGNCVWSTPKEQQRNTRRNRYIQFGERRVTISEFAEIAGLRKGCVLYRLEAEWSGQLLGTRPDRRWHRKDPA